MSQSARNQGVEMEQLYLKEMKSAIQSGGRKDECLILYKLTFVVTPLSDKIRAITISRGEL